ncbi:MAG: hypothetical protein ACTHOK_12925 [Nocardioidaceae bacterium]
MDTPRPFDRQDPFTWPHATEDDLASFTREERAAFDAVMGNASEELPPGPWAWRAVTPFSASLPDTGQALVAADGSWVAWSESGYGTVETSHPAVKDLLARAWELAPPQPSPATCSPMTHANIPSTAWTRRCTSSRSRRT